MVKEKYNVYHKALKELNEILLRLKIIHILK